MAQVTLRDYLQETEDAIGGQQTEKALANCQSILAYFPDSLEGQRLLGEVYLAQGRFDDAQHSFDWVLSNDPENVIAYCSRALVSERLSDYDTALDCYQQAYELSRGNSRIRHAFNQLSAQIGQQGFMLSRAGLARLYMRGDLIAQAIQEWEVVLAVTPDRLDARTGLLEAYWREGLYEQASQVANQILKDVPGCLKALVLLAHVTAPQNMLRSQELIQRAEALDPDLIMAHDLFADQLASQSRDPFLKLLRKPATLIGEDVARLETAKGTVSTFDQPTAQVYAAYASTSTPSSDALATWGNSEGWGNETTLVKPRHDESDQQAVPSLSVRNTQSSTEGYTGSPADMLRNTPGGRWSIDEPHSVSWDTLKSDPEPASSPSPSPDDNDQQEPWQLLQNTLNNMNADTTWSQPQLDPSQPEVQPFYNDSELPIWSAQERDEHIEEANAGLSKERSAASFNLVPQPEENNSPDAPAWLSMLTQDERDQLSGIIPVVKPGKSDLTLRSSTPMPAAQVEPVAIPDLNTNLIPSSNSSSHSEVEQDDAGDAGEEESLFGPNWLKSIGATTLDGEQAEEFSMSVPSVHASSEIAEITELQGGTQETWRAQVEQSEPGSKNTLQPERYLQSEQDERARQGAQEKQEQPKRESWLDSLDTASEYQHYESAYPRQPWENGQAASSQSQVEYNEETWAAPPYEANILQDSQAQPSYSRDVEPEETHAAWSAQNVQPPEQAEHEQGSWLDALGSSPEFEHHQTTYRPWGDSEFAESQPQFERKETEPQADEAWDAHWPELEQTQPSWLSQISEAQSQKSQPVEETWQPLPMDMQPETSAGSEQNLITTLEELEQKLRSRGFIPLEPNSLSTISQAQNASHASHSQEEPAASEVYDTQEYRQEPSLSSALAELGNFIQPAASPEKSASTSNRGDALEDPAIDPAAEPSWLASLRAVPAPPLEPILPVIPEVVAQNMTAREKAPEIEDVPPPQKQEIKPAITGALKSAPTSPARPELTFSPAFEATPVSKVQKQPESLQTASARINPLLDSELETTMKRPAVRLQPMQKRALPSREVPAQSRNRIAESATFNSAPSVSGLADSGYRERLLRGYQSQLIGDYDGAMQEYRVIIRNAPELLSEVISNLRALLKLAPKYSAGYRVLGDAYMRQGEYLQAMEAYNKALTMAKKARN
ncbi:MAG: hypothetical protein PVS3B1_12560 [Ktedonobacteraceae bacterium]